MNRSPFSKSGCSGTPLRVDCWDGYAPGAQGGPKTKIGKNGDRVNNCEEIGGKKD
tara:strand:+ start:27875 stop:28039 length:165 start_codon:yes stop_codon:yes gene_type:complete